MQQSAVVAPLGSSVAFQRKAEEGETGHRSRGLSQGVGQRQQQVLPQYPMLLPSPGIPIRASSKVGADPRRHIDATASLYGIREQAFPYPEKTSNSHKI